MFEIRVKEEFEAAHRVAGYPGKCDRMHGHSWTVEAVVRGHNLDDLGMLVDFKDIKQTLKDTLERFDHHYLNELAPFKDGVNPTAENLARIIFEELAGNEIFKRDSVLAAITVFESPKSSVTYTKD